MFINNDIATIALNKFRALATSKGDILYHYTSLDRVESIKNKGLILGSKRNTLDGNIRGIYITSNDDGTDFELEDFISDEKIVRLSVDISKYIDNIYIDCECYPYNGNCDDVDDFIWEVTGDGDDFYFFAYIDINISPKDIISYNVLG